MPSRKWRLAVVVDTNVFVEQADAAAGEEWGPRLLRATTLEELGLLENGGSAS